MSAMRPGLDQYFWAMTIVRLVRGPSSPIVSVPRLTDVPWGASRLTQFPGVLSMRRFIAAAVQLATTLAVLAVVLEPLGRRWI
jgi:hypothetical protein